MLSPHRALRLALLGAITLACSMPAFAQKLTAPLWDVYVVDVHGQPVSGLAVTQIRRYHACESKDHQETLFTDVDGHVQFRPKYLKAGAFKCGAETSEKVITFQEHHRHVSIFVGNPAEGLSGRDVDKLGRPIDWTGTPDHMKSHVIVHPPIPMPPQAPKK